MTETPGCTAEEKYAALERALASRTFARTDQLRAFLRFVCEAEIEGRGADVTECVIGVEVLGRPKGYSPAEDSSVRTRAYELRQKLQKLYSTELIDEPVRVVITKGGYHPQFVGPPVHSEEQTVTFIPRPEPKEIAGSGAPGHGRNRVALFAVAALLAAGTGAVIAYLALRDSPGSNVDPVVAEAWRPMAKQNANVVLSIAAPLHLILGPKGRTNHGLPDYPAPPETYSLYRQHRPLPPGALLDMTFTDNALGFGTMSAVVTTVNTLRSLRTSYQILPDRAVPISAVRERNVVLFGSPLDSETISRSVETAPLIVDFEPSVRSFVVRDRTSGRVFVPKPDGKGGFNDVYGLVTVLNTRDSDHGRLGMVIFSGTNSAGTDGAAGFFSSPRYLRSLQSVFARDGLAGFPSAYQVVVKCTFGDLLMISYEYSSHRILQK